MFSSEKDLTRSATQQPESIEKTMFRFPKFNLFSNIKNELLINVNKHVIVPMIYLI